MESDLVFFMLMVAKYLYEGTMLAVDKLIAMSAACDDLCFGANFELPDQFHECA